MTGTGPSDDPEQHDDGADQEPEAVDPAEAEIHQIPMPEHATLEADGTLLRAAYGPDALKPYRADPSTYQAFQQLMQRTGVMELDRARAAIEFIAADAQDPGGPCQLHRHGITCRNEDDQLEAYEVRIGTNPSDEQVIYFAVLNKLGVVPEQNEIISANALRTELDRSGSIYLRHDVTIYVPVDLLRHHDLRVPLDPETRGGENFIVGTADGFSVVSIGNVNEPPTHIAIDEFPPREHTNPGLHSMLLNSSRLPISVEATADGYIKITGSNDRTMVLGFTPKISSTSLSGYCEQTLANSPLHDLKIAAGALLHYSKADRAEEILIKQLDDNTPAVGIYAAHALAEIATPTAFAALEARRDKGFVANESYLEKAILNAISSRQAA